MNFTNEMVSGLTFYTRDNLIWSEVVDAGKDAMDKDTLDPSGNDINESFLAPFGSSEWSSTGPARTDGQWNIIDGKLHIFGDDYTDMLTLISQSAEGFLVQSDFTQYSTQEHIIEILLLATVPFSSARTYDEIVLEGRIHNGTLGNDILNGDIENNTLYGYDGKDTLVGGLGADTMYGGAGNDTYYVDNTGDKVYETTTATSGINAGGTDTVISTINYTLGAFVENLRIINTTTAVNGTGNTLNNTIYAGAGNNILNGGAGIDTISYAYATSATTTGVTASLAVTTTQATGISGSDTILNFENLTGSNYADRLTGNNGNNILNGGAGIDTMIGGLGNDVYYVDNIGDVITETSTLLTEIDTVVSSVTRTLGANIEKLSLSGTAAINGTGNALNNTLTGNAAANTLDGGNGNDIVYAGAGNDLIGGSAGNDYLDGGTGIDAVSYLNAGTVSGIGVTVNLSITTQQNTGLTGGIDTIINIENLYGSNNNDILSGNSGNNILNGKLGNDTLTGGTGLDTFIFNTAYNATTNKDTIPDFNVTDDTIKLENAIFTKLTTTGTLNTANFYASATGTAHDANDYIVYNTSTGVLSYDADGNTAGSVAAVQIALIGTTTHAALTFADFVVI